MRIKLFNILEHAFSSLERWAQDMRIKTDVCPDCGRNRYYGEPCIYTDKEGLRPHKK